MTAAQSLKIYEVLNKHFGDTADATTVVTEIEQIVENRLDQRAAILATKADVAEVKVDIIKWMVGFFIAQMTTQLAVLVSLLLRN